MPEPGLGDDWYAAMCEDEFGEDASSIRTFLHAHRKRGTKPEDARKDLSAILAAVFNDGIVFHLRRSLWQPLEQARTKLGLTQEQVADALRLAPSTYSKIQAGGTNLESALLFVRPLRLELRDLPLPAHSEQTVAGLLATVPLVRTEVFGMKPTTGERVHTLTPDDVEWLLHLDVCGEVWLTAFLRRDEQVGATVAACVAASVGLRRNQTVKPRAFSSLVELWTTWFKAWELCMTAIPTGRCL